MKKLPKTENSLVLRTDFSDDSAWKSVCAAIREPSAWGYRACVDCHSDPEYDGLTTKQLTTLASIGSDHSFVFIVDRVALSHSEQPILVVDLYTEPGRSFRVIPCEMSSVQANLSIGNMDFAEFADSVDKDGVFRGFPKS